MHAAPKISAHTIRLRVAGHLTWLLLTLSGCGDVQTPVDEQTAEVSGASAAETPSERPSSSASAKATDEALDIALWGGPLVTPLQKWRPQRADGESAPDDAD